MGNFCATDNETTQLQPTPTKYSNIAQLPQEVLPESLTTKKLN